MRDVELFQAALGLAEPWRVVGSSFDADQRRLELRIDFERGARFACPECDAAGCEVHDTDEKTWRHLDFFQHQAFLVARVPRVRCAEHGVRQVGVPWARPGSGFTLLFEALTMALVAEMPVKAVGDLVGEHDPRIWRVVHHYVDSALGAQDLSTVTRVAVDETSFRRGQDYVSVFADLDQARVVFVTPGRDAGAYARFAGDLAAHGGAADQVAEVCQDMSESYLTGALEHLPNAEITFDRYHIKAQLTKAVDEVRRSERVEHAELLRHTRYLWLKSPANLTARQHERLQGLLRLPLATGRAYRWMLRFDGVYEIEDPDQAAAYLRRWQRGALRSRLGPIIDLRPPRTRVLARDRALVALTHLQRPARRPALPRPSRQTPRPRLPLHPQLHRHDPPHRRQARHRCYPLEVAKSRFVRVALFPSGRSGSDVGMYLGLRWVCG